MVFFVVFVLFWPCFVISVSVAAQSFKLVKDESVVNISTETIEPTLIKSTDMAGDLLRNSCRHRNQKRPVKSLRRRRRIRLNVFGQRTVVRSCINQPVCI